MKFLNQNSKINAETDGLIQHATVEKITNSNFYCKCLN